MNVSLLALSFLSLFLNCHGIGEQNTHQFCWFDNEEQGQECFGGVVVEWVTEPPNTVIAGTKNQVSWRVVINTTQLPVVGCEVVIDNTHNDHHNHKHGDEVHDDNDNEVESDQTTRTGVAVAGFVASCAAQRGTCSPQSAVIEHELSLCQTVSGTCKISEPTSIDNTFPLYLQRETAEKLSPTSEAIKFNYGEGRDFYFPSGWDDIPEQQQRLLLENTTVSTTVDCDSTMCSQAVDHPALEHYNTLLPDEEFRQSENSEIVTVELSFPFVLVEANSAHTLLAFVRLATCGGSHGNVTFLLGLKQFGLIVKPAPRTLVVSERVKLTMLGFQVAGGVILISLFAVLVTYRKHHVIRDAQGVVLMLIVVVGAVSIFFTAARDPTVFGCAVQAWTFGALQPLMFCLLCARVWRVDSLHRAARMCRRRTISLWGVLSVTFALWSPVAIICTLQNLVHPSHLRLRHLPTGLKQVWSCESLHSEAYMVAVLLYDAALLAVCVLAAVRSNQLTDKYNEGKIIAFAIQNAVVVFLMTTPVVLLQDGASPSTSFFLSSISVILTVVILCCSLIVPRVKYLLSEAPQEWAGDSESEQGYQVGGEVVPKAKEVLKLVTPLSKHRETISTKDAQKLQDAMSQMSKLIFGQVRALRRRQSVGKVVFGRFPQYHAKTSE